MLLPPVDVALAQTRRELPADFTGWQAEGKWDGIRLLVFRTPDGVILQTRGGQRATDTFPDLAQAAAQLPCCVLDGEAVVFVAGRTDFAAVLRRSSSGRARAAALARRQPANFVAFDVLWDPEEGDVRTRPWRERRSRLVDLLAPLGPPVQPTPATADRDVAEAWLTDLGAIGCEGLVLKRTEGIYRAGRSWAWQKLKRVETVDAVVLGVVGPVRRPRALAVALPGGHDAPVLTTRISGQVAAQIGEAVAALPDGPQTVPDPRWTPVPLGLVVEVAVGVTRGSETVRVLRLREQPGPHSE